MLACVSNRVRFGCDLESLDTARSAVAPVITSSISPIKHILLEIIRPFHPDASPASTRAASSSTSRLRPAESTIATATASSSSPPPSASSPAATPNTTLNHPVHQPSSVITVPHSDTDPNATDSPGTFAPSFISHPAIRRAAGSLALVLLGLSVKYLIVKHFQQTPPAWSQSDGTGLVGSNDGRGDEQRDHYDNRARRPQSWRERLGYSNVARRQRLKTWWKSQLRRVSWSGGRRSGDEEREDEDGEGERITIREVMADGRGNIHDDNRFHTPMASANEYSGTAMLDEILGFRRVLEYVGELISPMDAQSTTTATTNPETQPSVIPTSTFSAHQAPHYQRHHQPSHRYSSTDLSISSIDASAAAPGPPMSPLSQPHQQPVTPV